MNSSTRLCQSEWQGTRRGKKTTNQNNFAYKAFSHSMQLFLLIIFVFAVFDLCCLNGFSTFFCVLQCCWFPLCRRCIAVFVVFFVLFFLFIFYLLFMNRHKLIYATQILLLRFVRKALYCLWSKRANLFTISQNPTLLSFASLSCFDLWIYIVHLFFLVVVFPFFFSCFEVSFGSLRALYGSVHYFKFKRFAFASTGSIKFYTLCICIFTSTRWKNTLFRVPLRQQMMAINIKTISLNHI